MAPKRNVEYEQFVFREAKQLDTEAVDSYHTRLQQLAKTCEFTDCDGKSQIIQGCLSNKLRRMALRETKTLADLLTTARSFEVAELHALGMETKTELSTNAVRARPRQLHQPPHNSDKSQHNERKCFNCGRNYPHEDKCPATGKTCNTCGKLNHFSNVCRQAKHDKKSTHNKHRPRKAKSKAITERKHECDSSSADDDDQYVFIIDKERNSGYSTQAKDKTDPWVNVRIEGSVLPVLIDTGATLT
ncbi:hypothetical protein BSL78_13017 [Apostichopus japonicus]|uniref:CCHC-type domain-containing protein n=1 Tax=Stichopus japonicus TaxID=307972 RepID=A0A2G8KQ09_STIJA|nr:hypothetical protein BSL78_13017 [Apostichopus japonicus]